MSRKKSDVSLKFNTEKYSFEEQVQIYNILQENFTKVPCKILSYICKKCSHSDSGKLESVLNSYFSRKSKSLSCTWSMDCECSGVISFKEEVSLKFINDFFTYENFTDLFKLVEIDYEEKDKSVYVTMRKL